MYRYVKAFREVHGRRSLNSNTSFELMKNTSALTRMISNNRSLTVFDKERGNFENYGKKLLYHHCYVRMEFQIQLQNSPFGIDK